MTGQLSIKGKLLGAQWAPVEEDYDGHDRTTLRHTMMSTRLLADRPGDDSGELGQDH